MQPQYLSDLKSLLEQSVERGSKAVAAQRARASLEGDAEPNTQPRETAVQGPPQLPFIETKR